jgi:DNA mismatch endonuclease (patch repair protein)
VQPPRPVGSGHARAGKGPSFVGLAAASAASSLVKQKNRAKDTQHEVVLRRELFRLGLRFRKNVSTLPGKPDVVFAGPKVVVFCDGDFWHGRRWNRLRAKLAQGHNASYWQAKILANIQRDRRHTRTLRKAGWIIIRLWETDVRKDPIAAARKISAVLTERSG